MIHRNEQYLLKGLDQHDEIYIGTLTKNGKRGLG